MDSTLSVTATRFTLAKVLNSSSNPLVHHLHRRFYNARASQLALLRLTRILTASSRRVNSFDSISSPKSLGDVVLRPLQRRLGCASVSASSFASGGGDFGGDDGNNGAGGGGGGDGAAEGGEAKPNAVAGGADDVSALSSDVIILDVGGMTCGGCAASVKRILESQPQVSSASVNLTTETAIVWPVSEAKVVPNWKKQLGEGLAKHLTTCGFTSNLRGESQWQMVVDSFEGRSFLSAGNSAFVVMLFVQVEAIHALASSIEDFPCSQKIMNSRRENFFETFEKKMNEKRTQLKESGHGLVVSWALCAVCLVGHLSHFLGAKASWIHALHSTGFHMSLSLFTLLGPGRQLIIDGLKSLFKGSPNMNTLVGLGALSSFAVSSLAAFVPKLGWKTFFEEPVMLIAFVLLGRNLEQRAKIKATSDMTGLLSILPSKAHLIVNDGTGDSSSTVEVESYGLNVGDQILVLPGDRVPADGIVRAGRSTIDESSFTGEPLPVTKLPGAEVAAGSVNLNGTLTIEVRRPGGETTMGDIVRLVEEAQTREAPVQRLADKIAGHFTYGVMALSAATFVFWNLFGAQVLPATLHQTNAVSLALQLSCSVLVVACPCALGLATPTAVLVGTSLGAKRGLLLRGGSILEKFSMVNTIVFDKTGTLTLGRPVVTKVITQGCGKDAETQQDLWLKLSESDVLRLAAGVEKNTNHPIGKAIVAAAQAVNCPSMKAADGTFVEEPGSGAVATIENKKVSVGSLEWIKRHGVNQFPLQEVEEFKNQSAVYVGVDGDLAGIIYVEDQIREDAKHVIESLSRQGMSTYLLSGDKKDAAQYVASIVGIPKDNVLYGVKPAEKKMFINSLQKDQNVVAMVGDGINDAAALASSDVGVAIVGGVEAASEVSSIVLMHNKLSQLLDALELSRLTMKTVKQNLWWAFAYNIVGLPIAAGVLLPVTGTMLTPSIAGALMGLSSIGVMTNSLFLRFKFASGREKTDEPLLRIEVPPLDAENAAGQKNSMGHPSVFPR